MKQFALIVPLAALALSSTASAQSSVLDHLTLSTLQARVDRIFQMPGQEGTGFGAWVGPTTADVGNAAGVMVDANGGAAWTLDASLTRYVLFGLGVEYGGLYGRLIPAPGTSDDLMLPTLVQGEWMRLTGQHGKFAAIVFRSAGFPQSVEIAGAVRGTIRYDMPGSAGPGRPAAQYAGTVDAVAGRFAHDSYDLANLGGNGGSGGGGRTNGTLQRVGAQPDIRDQLEAGQIPDLADLAGASGAGDPGMSLVIENADAPGATVDRLGTLNYADVQNSGNGGGTGVAAAAVENAPSAPELQGALHQNDQDLLSPRDPQAPRIETGLFEMSFHMLD